MKTLLSQDKINEQKVLSDFKAKQCLPKFHVSYPDVTACTITYFRQTDSINKIIRDEYPHVLRLNIQEGSSMVTISCINIDCTIGFIDISSVIRDMVSHHKTYEEGKLICKGFQDAERINLHLCRSELLYKIQIDYSL